jgi:hypothetical protein
MSKRIALMISLALGAIGAVGEAFLLRHELVECYPYKIMDPYGLIFDRIGETGFIIAPAIAIVLMFAAAYHLRTKVIAVPAVVCPIVYYAVFVYIFAKSQIPAVELTRPIYDQMSLTAAREVFWDTAFEMLVEGLFIGVGCTVLISIATRYLPGWLFSNRLRLP